MPSPNRTLPFRSRIVTVPVLRFSIFIFLTPGYAPNLINYLFGSILTVSKIDIMLSLALAILISGFFLLFFKTILYISFDEEFARTRKIRVQIMNYILISFVALTIVLSIKIAGIILIISLLTIPQVAANLFFKNFKTIIFVSVALGFIGIAGGLIISYFLNIPSGASIIFLLVLIFTFLSVTRRFISVS